MRVPAARAPARRRVAAGRRRSRRRRFVFYDALALVRDRRRARRRRARSHGVGVSRLSLGSAPVPAIARRLYLPPDVFLGPRRLLERPRTSPHILSLRPPGVPSPAVPAPAAPAPPVDEQAPLPELHRPGSSARATTSAPPSSPSPAPLAAARGMDILGCTIVGTITAVGGGTVRDILLGRRSTRACAGGD